MVPGEGKDDVETPEEDIKVDPTTGKFPETVPSNKYIGVKEALGRAKEKVSSLDEQLKNAPNKDEFTRITQELADTKAKLQTKDDELTKKNEASASELRETLKTQGLTDEQTKDMSEAEMKRMIGVLGSKPKSLPDLGGGGGGGSVPKGSPMQLARDAYGQSSKGK